ncbi:MAG: SMC-Scp complex subunit ScpB [Methanocellales archaeon]|nr:SMC-Scp complex subunit ScpB [Methanocellales archaeon]
MNDKKVLEAALFAVGQPLDVKELAELVGKPPEYVSELLKSLVGEYKTRETSLELVEVRGKYVMQVKPVYAEKVQSIAPKEFETPVLRTLAVIAYHQPVTQAEVVSIRGNKAYSHVVALEERGLIKSVLHRRTKMLTTTPAFVEYFGIEANDPKLIRRMIEKVAKEQISA